MTVDVVLLLHVIYSQTIAPVANVFCWLYPTLNKIYLILSLSCTEPWIRSVSRWSVVSWREKLSVSYLTRDVNLSLAKPPVKLNPSCAGTELTRFKDRAHLSTFKIFIFEKFSCFIVLVVFLVIVQSSELVSVWFCEKWHFFLIFLVTTCLRYMGAGLPWGCRPLAG